MKAKITIRNMLFLVFSVIMLCSVMCMSASAVDCDCDLGEDGWSEYIDIPCLEQKWCSVHNVWVQRPVKDASKHSAGLWEVITPNTCQSAGLEAILCTECKQFRFEEREIPAHDYEVVFGEDATCMKTGYRLHVCMTCFDVVNEELPIDRVNGHKFTEWQTVKEATCVEASGEEVRYCTCYSAEGQKCDYKEERKVSKPENHIDDDWESDDVQMVPATCEKAGYYHKICSGCEKEIRKEIPQHSQTRVEEICKVVPSTCVTNGVETRKCSCGTVYDIELPVDDKNHVYGEWVVEKEPGCTVGKRYKSCKHHYDVKIWQEIPGNGEHSFGPWETVIEPDCTKTGLEKQTCADCGKVVTRELPTKHDYTVWITKVKMSCNESNPTPGSKLAQCNECPYEKYFTVPALHNFGPWVIVEPSSCEKGNEGKMKRTCQNKDCGKVETKTYVQEHDFSDWYVTKEPTCATDEGSGIEGRRTRWCKVCNKIEHKAIPVTHEYEEEILVYATCKESGEVKYSCRYCDKTYTEPVVLAHEYAEAEIGVGKDADWKPIDEKDITSCDMMVTEKSRCIYCGDIRYTSKAAGHTYGNWYVEGGKVDCTKEGTADSKTFTRKCTRKDCNATQFNDISDKISLKHPNLKTVVIAATCTTSGYTMQTCPDCDYSEIVGDIEPAKGHKLDESWSSKLPATCTTEGSRYKACANCDYLEYQYIEKAQHFLMTIDPGYPATCTLPGRTPQSYCVNCKAVFESKETEPLGHSYAEGSEVCVRCNAYKGSDKSCTCACHSQIGMEKIFFQFINKIYQFFGINQQCKCGDLHYTEPGFLAKLFGKA